MPDPTSPTLADLVRHRYRLAARCGVCGRYRTVALHGLVRKLGHRATVDDVRRRLRCTGCGAKVCAIQVVIEW